MIFTYKALEALIKIFFSAIIIQLFVVCLGAGNGCFTPGEVLSMLEYSCASCVVSLGGVVLLEYVLKSQ